MRYNRRMQRTKFVKTLAAAIGATGLPLVPAITKATVLMPAICMFCKSHSMNPSGEILHIKSEESPKYACKDCISKIYNWIEHWERHIDTTNAETRKLVKFNEEIATLRENGLSAYRLEKGLD